MMKTRLAFFMFGLLFAINIALPSHASSNKLSRDVNYERALNWIKDNNKWGKNAVVVSEFKEELDSAIGKNRAAWKIGWGITKSGTAYGIEWTPKGIFFNKYSREQAQRLGYEENSTTCTIR